MSRIHVYVLPIVLAACSFEGSSGALGDGSDGPDAGVDAAGSGSGSDAGPDGTPMPKRCEEFTEIGGSHYRLSAQAASWNDAKAECESVAGGHLATFSTLAEISMVVEGLPLTVKAWTGVFQKKPTNRMSLNWMNNDESLIPSPFPWDGGEPNDGGGWFPGENGAEDVAELRSNGRFNDERPTTLNRALCECEEDDAE